MKKFCIFCGEKPQSKNKEHIIPQWLIKLTGDPKRNINLGIDFFKLLETKEFEPKSFSFDSFQFPSCESCNTSYSLLEGKTKFILEKILNNDFLSNKEIDTLLDWFDKVRIGLWLGMITLDKRVDIIDPKFHINKRISHRDRCLFIYELNEVEWKGIQFIGTNSPGFNHIPSCFSFRTNNIYFFNYSFDFLFSKNIGFPYPRTFKTYNDDVRYTYIEFAKGINKISLPLINQKFLKASTYIYQPIIPSEINDLKLESLYNEEYVRENCLDFQNRKGAIFYFDKKLIKLTDDNELMLTGGPKYNFDSFKSLIANQTFETIELLLKLKPHKEILDKEKAQRIEENRKQILNLHRMFKKLEKKLQ